MRTGRIVGDLALLEQGVEVAVGFGLRSLEGLVDVAELLEQSVYEARSLRRTPAGFQFTLLNPPLRMGAFSSVRLIWNGAAIGATDVTIALPGEPPRGLDSIAPEHPVTLPVGRRTRFAVVSGNVPSGRQQLRLELQSVAVPPKVWFEFSDEIREPDGG